MIIVLMIHPSALKIMGDIPNVDVGSFGSGEVFRDEPSPRSCK